MPLCNIEREILGAAVTYRIGGKFEGACAWELSRRLLAEPLADVTFDFSQVTEFVDYGVAVMANAILSATGKQVRLAGLRWHHTRLFRYFGYDPDQPADQRAQPTLDTAALLALEIR